MEWTNVHDVMFCREVIAFEPFSHKPGSKERGQCLDRIAESLNAISEPYFKVDQRSLRDRIKKLIKSFVTKRNNEEKASGIEVEHSELDDLLLDIYDKHKAIESEALAASEKVRLSKDKDKEAAEEVRAMAAERLSETRKRSGESSNSENDGSKCKQRSSGGDTIAYLREKSEREFVLRERELENARAKDDATQRQIQLLIENAQQQTSLMVNLISKMTEKDKK